MENEKDIKEKVESPFAIKYRDKDGVIHILKPGDHEGFRKMMSEKTNTLIFG